MEEFFSFVGVVTIALWAGAEIHHAMGGWIVPLLIGICVGVLVGLAAFRDFQRVPPVLQGLALGIFAGIGVFRVVFLNFDSEADRLGGLFCGLLMLGVVWIMQARMKGDMRTGRTWSD